jgi:lipid A 3-O-deacylase
VGGRLIIRILHRLGFTLVAVVALCAAVPQAKAQEPGFLTIGGGAFDFHRSETRAAQFELQYRPELKLWIFNPMIGASGTTDGALYGYAGLSVDIFFGNRVVLRPSVAAGAYHKGNGKDLGGVLEFRSGLELAYRFDDRSRLGMEISHRSNASIYEDNPGEETLMLFYHLPLSKLF